MELESVQFCFWSCIKTGRKNWCLMFDFILALGSLGKKNKHMCFLQQIVPMIWPLTLLTKLSHGNPDTKLDDLPCCIAQGIEAWFEMTKVVGDFKFAVFSGLLLHVGRWNATQLHGDFHIHIYTVENRSLYVPWSRLSRSIGDGDKQKSHLLMTESLFHWYIKPYYWVDEFIPYYMELMGV